MGVFYEKLLRPLLFTQDPEKAHDYGMLVLRQAGHVPGLAAVLRAAHTARGSRPIELFGLRFPNAVGLAAGMDKNGQIWRSAPMFGFGHVEIGTVTAQKQPGNVDRPRIFRLPKDEAIINRMGFNNDGAEAVAKRLKSMGANKRNIPLGINIGKSRVVSIDKATEDYLSSFHRLAEFADYITINVSSPNTPELRKLQGPAHLSNLLGALVEANRKRASKLGTRTLPILLKIAPDLDYPEIDSILDTLYELKLDGIIATNTTIERYRSHHHSDTMKESGGLSGRPLHQRSCKVINYIHRATDGKLPIIGVGGIMDPESAGRTMDAGASLVQIYTGWIYRGPFFPADVARALSWRHNNWA